MNLEKRAVCLSLPSNTELTMQFFTGTLFPSLTPWERVVVWYFYWVWGLFCPCAAPDTARARFAVEKHIIR